MSNRISLPILAKWKKEFEGTDYKEIESKIELKDADEIVIEILEEEGKLLNKLAERDYLIPKEGHLTPDEYYETNGGREKGWFYGYLVDLRNNLYVFIGDYRKGEVFINPIPDGLTLPRNIVAYKCKRYPNQECYKGILKGFGKEDEIGKKDLIVIRPILIKDTYLLDIIWTHERGGHLDLNKKIDSSKWYSWIRHIMERLEDKSYSYRFEKLRKKVKRYEVELLTCEELYSYLTELVSFFKLLHGSVLKEKEVLSYLERYVPRGKLYENYYYAKKYLQNSKVGRYLDRFTKNPSNSRKYIEEIIGICMIGRKKLEESLKFWFENELHPTLLEIEKELY
jgi:hypothetical protein